MTRSMTTLSIECSYAEIFKVAFIIFCLAYLSCIQWQLFSAQKLDLRKVSKTLKKTFFCNIILSGDKFCWRNAVDERYDEV
jgi:hypothetical protein